MWKWGFRGQQTNPSREENQKSSVKEKWVAVQ